MEEIYENYFNEKYSTAIESGAVSSTKIGFTMALGCVLLFVGHIIRHSHGYWL
ncbi:hypothetical protein DOY81_015385 [Sarcophaga bullata]|nr:hypothetical protein DOY81_015385 [Sarcophaga bullata]